MDTFDHTLIDSVSRGDSDELFRRIQIDQNANGVCGYPALYSLLELLHRSGKDVQGSLLSYEQSPEEETGSVVTFASMIFPPQITS